MSSASAALQRFLVSARGAGLAISPAEAMDALRVVDVVGYGDRAVLRHALGAVLAKSVADKTRYEAIFERYFNAAPLASAPGVTHESTAASAMPPLARRLLSADPAWLAPALEVAARSAKVENIRYVTQKNVYVMRMLRELGTDALPAVVAGLRASGAGGDAERLETAIAHLRAEARGVVDHHFALYGHLDTDRYREERLRSVRLASVDKHDVARMKVLVRDIARRLAQRYARVRRRRLRGQLDTRRTIRRNVGWGGVPFFTQWKQRRIERPRVVVLCDVSGSVAEVSTFLLMFLYALNEVLADLRAYAFAGSVADVGALLDGTDVDGAIAAIMGRIGFESSNYGHSLVQFEALTRDVITPRTTLLIVGDARGNGYDPRVEVFQRFTQRAKRTVWLNPEYRASWGTGDSDMHRYAPYCSLVRECNTLRHLERLVTDLLEQG